VTAPAATSTIVADAFRFMEVSPPSSFADDTEEARAVLQSYPTALDACLEAADWSFASRYAELPQLAALPEGEIADARLPYAYTLPGDLVKLREIVDAFTRWRIDAGGLLRTDCAGSLKIRYTRRTPDEAQLPATFRIAVAAQLATLLAPRFLTVRTKQADLAARAREAMGAALNADAMTASPERYDDQPWETGDDWVRRAVR
jgi:hypothetical protein